MQKTYKKEILLKHQQPKKRHAIEKIKVADEKNEHTFEKQTDKRIYDCGLVKKRM